MGSGQSPGDSRSIVELIVTNLATIQKNNDCPTALNEKPEISPTMLFLQQLSVIRNY